MSQTIKVIVGLGNPGDTYTETRHNAGFWFVDAIAEQAGSRFRGDSKFHGSVAKIGTTWLLKPATFMNRSGLSVAALCHFYKIPPESCLVVHDELDLDAGIARLKRSGGHGGHNGLRDITQQLGSKDFLRLRFGIGHPGHKSQVANYVLKKPSSSDREAINDALYNAQRVLDLVLNNDLEKAMLQLHSV